MVAPRAKKGHPGGVERGMDSVVAPRARKGQPEGVERG